MAFLHEKSVNLPTVCNIMPNASEETSEVELPPQRHAITSNTCSAEPCQP